MIFSSLTFVAFFAIVFVAYNFISSDRRTRLVILTIANFVFYGSWSWKFVPILLATGLVDFYLARAIARREERKQRHIGRRYLVLSLVLNIGVLMIFKYTNFALGTVTAASHALGLGFAAPILDIAVPLGVSFYTFQSMSYTIDVYLGSFKPKSDLIDFLASLTFFPHLLAGPIVRSSFLLPQFERLRAPDLAAIRRACLLIGLGAMKKAIADLMAPVADAAFHGAQLGPIDALSAWGGLMAFMGQVYGDFSGYTDMATGLAGLLGFTLPPNFNLPYLSTSPGMFWSRWHISLSTWFRDYLYYPLALGSFKGQPYRNTMVVMLVAGLWHGAGWNFLALGLYYGIGLASTQWLSRKLRVTDISAMGRVLAWIGTMWFVSTAQIFFRSQSISGAFRFFRATHAPVVACTDRAAGWLTLAIMLVGIAACHTIDWACIHRQGGLKRPTWVWPVAVLALTFALVFGSSQKSFIYFQF